MERPAGKREPKIGLVLPGGGARGAYQVGVLKAIGEVLPRKAPSPFAVLSGTSVGAISATVLATRASQFRLAVHELERVWGNFRCEQVFRSDAPTMFKTSLHWLAALIFGGLGAENPRSLLDNQPLWSLLRRRINFETIQRSIDEGHLDAIAITAAGYGTARSISFYQSRDEYHPWERVRRRGRPTRLTLEHLMASVAVPMIFPPVQIGQEYFGDGAMRQATPLSPALRLGADRLMVIGARSEAPEPLPLPGEPVPYPTFGKIAGYMLDALFLDGLSGDLENLVRLNLILEQVPGHELHGDFGDLRYTPAMIMLPSVDVRDIALRHVHEMPRPVRVLLKGMGALNYGGRQLLSYLMFESGYTRELIELGYRDGLERADEIRDFLAGRPVEVPGGVSGWRDLSAEYSQRLRTLSVPESAAG